MESRAGGSGSCGVLPSPALSARPRGPLGCCVLRLHHSKRDVHVFLKKKLKVSNVAFAPTSAPPLQTQVGGGGSGDREGTRGGASSHARRRRQLVEEDVGIAAADLTGGHWRYSRGGEREAEEEGGRGVNDCQCGPKYISLAAPGRSRCVATLLWCNSGTGGTLGSLSLPCGEQWTLRMQDAPSPLCRCSYSPFSNE